VSAKPTLATIEYWGIQLRATSTGLVSDIELAARHDSLGQHDDAINALARATKNNDIEATTLLGKRLLVGDRAPHLPDAGARFLLDATRLGGAEAADRLALLVGAGAFFEQDWNEALNLLFASAERGWRPAQNQIRVLATDRDLTDRAMSPGRPNDIWRRLAQSIDLTFWSTAPTPITLNESPVIKRFADLIPPRVSKWLIDRARGKLGPARVYDAIAGKETLHSTRTNTAAMFGLAEADLVTLLVQNRMASACGVQLPQMEAATVLHYDVGEEITDHYDFVDPRTPNYTNEIEQRGQRLITFLIYLNDDYDGGETEFPKLGLSHKGRLGDGMYFINAYPNGEPDLRTVHAGRPPESGEKWILSQFIRDRRMLSVQPVSAAS